jgi:hypothetical protein
MSFTAIIVSPWTMDFKDHFKTLITVQVLPFVEVSPRF